MVPKMIDKNRELEMRGQLIWSFGFEIPKKKD
jgi:hypothetical protein